MTDAYAAAYATPLIDREPILAEIEAAITGYGAPVFYITGPGGMGKTFLLREVLQRARRIEHPQTKLLVAHELIDLYHLHTHTTEGLCQAILSALRPDLAYFDDYHKLQARLQQAMPNVQSRTDPGIERKIMHSSFVEEFVRLTEDYRVVWELDTAELLLYETDPIQRLLGYAQPGIEVRDWLIHQLLPKLDNTVLLIAGRPEPPQLAQDLEDVLGERLVKWTLGPLDQESSLKYFRAAAVGARERGATTVAEQIEAVPMEARCIIHRYVGGRPILLSLVLDYLVVADRLLPALAAPLDEVEKLSDEEMQSIQRTLEAEIVRSIQETGRTADETIRMLALMRRGLDAPLLSQLAGIAREEAKRRLDQVIGLSFVKGRRDDERLFLQDEMYNLLQRHVLDPLPSEQAHKIYAQVATYYGKEIEAARHDLHRLQEDPTADAKKVGQARLRLQDAIAEKVHYELRRDPVSGFQAYHQAAEEAFGSQHEAMDMQLREEMLTFLKQAPAWSRALVEDLATWDAGVRWVKRNLAHAQYAEAIRIAKQLRIDQAELMRRLGILAEAELDVAEANALIYAGQDLDLALDRLSSSVSELECVVPANPFDTWRRIELLSDAYNLLGYLHRNRGSHADAVSMYHRALPYWRAKGKEAWGDYANTLNNLAYALAETGEFDQALRYCRDALEMREKLGPRYPVALSMNTMGMIQIEYDQAHRAVRMSERALGIFRQLDTARGIGMSSRCLAEALRRQAEVPRLYDYEEQAAKLRQAERHADEAVKVFTRQVRERSRQVDALIELGCIYRDWARIRDRYESDEDSPASDLAERAVVTLRRAISEAGDSFPHLKLDALVNLAWHYFNVGQSKQARTIIDTEARPLVSAYLITKGKGRPKIENPVAYFWVQLGKAELLLGQIEMAKFRKIDKGKPIGWEEKAARNLRAAAEHYTLALEYNLLFGMNYREMRRALDAVYDQVKSLNRRELLAVYDAVEASAAKFRLGTEVHLRSFLEEIFGSAEVLGRLPDDREHLHISL